MLDLTVAAKLQPQQEEKLQKRFLELCQKFQISDEEAQTRYQQLYQLYNEPHRAYHNWVHINNFLNLLDLYNTEIQEKGLFEWAIWYHDAIYNIKDKDNEWQSAILFQNLFHNNLNKKELEWIDNLIMSTAGHQPRAEENDVYYFLDFDLAILAAEPKVYKTYSKAIAEEYQTLYPKLIYKMGRKKVLKNFLDRPKLFFSKVFFEKYETIARQNLQLELNGK